MTSTVARIAYLASDTLVDLQLPPPNTSLSIQTFTSLSTASRQRPAIVSIPSGGDPVGSILRNASASLISFTASANPRTITNIILRISELSSLPLVLHFALDGDLSDVLLLRSAIPFFLLSTTAQQAHDHALLASKLARTEKKAVVHAYYSSTADIAQEVPEDQVVPFLLDSRLSKHSPAASNGHVSTTNGNGVNGHTNGVNGTNDHANSHSNGHSEESTDNSAVNDLFKAYEIVALSTVSLVRRPLRPLVSQGASDAETIIFTLGHELPATAEGVSITSVSLVTPLPPSRIIAAIPPTAKRVIVLEHISKWSMKWTPLYLDVVSALQGHEPRPIVQSGVFGAVDGIASVDILKFLQHASTSSPSTRLELSPPSASTPSSIAPLVPKHEASYSKILAHLFDDRLEVANSPSLVASQGEIATTPEFALGRVRAQLEQRQQLINAVQELLQSGAVDVELHSLLSKWTLAKDDSKKSKGLGEEIVASLKLDPLPHPAATRILSLRAHFPVVSRWIIGSDAWSYDLGSSGLHHAVASGLNVNVLIIDSLPYSSRNSGEPSRRKHDVGLYAMNHGDVYVASVAVYSSYAQVLQAFTEADHYDGPSVVLAYLPYVSDNSPALEVLKETKLAVDSGYWPLYRWDPSKDREGKEPFSLDSDSIKNDLQQFLDRQNHLSQLVRSKPAMATELVSSLGQSVKEARKQKAQQSYNELLSSLDAPPLLILYASDGGNAEKKAKRLSHRAQARGLSTTTLASFDSMPLDSLAQEEYVVFITSTAGQGEPPQNGRQFYKALNAAAASGDRTLTKLKFGVFGMGDSHYWPRPEDAHYYNKPGKDLDSRLEKLGGERVVELGLGDDQDADGPETGYKPWEQLLWKVLGVDSIEITEAEPEPITNEHIKAASQYLRGTIAEGLQDFSTGALAPSDGQLTKFHGIYQQDDRDIRDERQAQGAELAYSFMIRVRMPGGVCTPEQWLQMDEIADEHGCGTFKITTRATFQFHGVIKRHLKPAIQDINRVLLDTLAACGDVNRNVICSSIPTMSKLHSQVFAFTKAVSEHLIPRTTAYHEIWLDKKMVAGDAVKDFEPLYGEFYLPRKFKVAVAVPPTNDVDVFANDLGFFAIVGNDGELTGFNVSVGGGMGVTHGNKKTYPRAGSIIGFCTPEQGKLVAEKVMLTQRDNGNRADRKNARLKYTIDRMGLDVFKAEVEKRLGFALQPARPFTFDRNVDDYGWATGEDGKHHFLMFIENGRIQDEPGKDFKTGLREVAKVHKGTFRLTANQHLVISDVPNEELPVIKEILAKYKLDNLVHSGLRLSSSACVAFPTCGLAMAESERYLPLLIDKVEKICEKNGLRNDSIVMRMTGCPNGCARPYLGEVAFIGKAPGSYSMLLGGGFYGQRLNKIYRETVTEPEILAILEPMIKRYALERLEGERFGDFTIRAGYISATTSGKEWYVGMGGEGEYKESS
ncbi:sulfite reductase subunit beta [Desarmillaria tabescens]|uniref:assimilatory sulfite reductase (NADPH) n=1 Tax=Armillaria tabescens TaxID=1929756 RepID=A0AA39NKN3_ARMTA|nr:sulfite reductase subunit beta [Desarmillaria tabescens]KAK0467284.1 sulfite reductase subunit beta [Desarmillaria tabescens]